MTWPHRRFALLVVGLLVVTAGCSGGLGSQFAGGDGQEASSRLEPTGGDTSLSAPEADGTKESSENRIVRIRDRAVIKTGRVRVEVSDFDDARRNLSRKVAAFGGFVSDSRVDVERVDNTSVESGTLVLRVPSENFSEMMAHAKAVGTLESSGTNSKDVTDKLVDIDARLENLRAERDRLRQLYERANDTEAILQVQRRLSDVQGEIERLEARKKQLRRKVELSTIRVELHEPRPDAAGIDASEWYDTPILAAFLASVDGVLVTVRAFVVAAAYVLPYVLVFAPPVVLVAYALRRSGSLGATLPFRDE